MEKQELELFLKGQLELVDDEDAKEDASQTAPALKDPKVSLVLSEGVSISKPPERYRQLP